MRGREGGGGEMRGVRGRDVCEGGRDERERGGMGRDERGKG